MKVGSLLNVLKGVVEFFNLFIMSHAIQHK